MQAVRRLLPGLLAGSYEDLVDGDPAVPGDDVGHGVGDVLGAQQFHALDLTLDGLPHAVAEMVFQLPNPRGLVTGGSSLRGSLSIVPLHPVP